jgi:hypothetical protein
VLGVEASMISRKTLPTAPQCVPGVHPVGARCRELHSRCRRFLSDERGETTPMAVVMYLTLIVFVVFWVVKAAQVVECIPDKLGQTPTGCNQIASLNMENPIPNLNEQTIQGMFGGSSGGGACAGGGCGGGGDGISSANAAAIASAAQQAANEATAAAQAGNTLPAPPTVNWQNCFVAGTLVATPSGLLPIEQIRTGDDVLSLREETGETVVGHIGATFVTPDQQVLDVHLVGDSPPIRATTGHLFLTLDRGWQPAAQLQSGEPLADSTGLPIRVESITPVAAHDTVYNLDVEDTHTYFVGPARVTVHNFNPGCQDGGEGQPFPGENLTTTQLAPGVVWQKYKYPDLYCGAQRINVIDVDLSVAYVRPVLTSFPTNGSGYEKATDMGLRAGAIAGVNGNFFCNGGSDDICTLPQETAQPSCEVDFCLGSNDIPLNGFSCAVPSGLALLEIQGTAMALNCRSSRATLTLNGVGRAPSIQLVAPRAYSGAPFSVGGGPFLVRNGVPDVDDEGFRWPCARTSRTAVALDQRGHLLMVTFDKASGSYKGVSLIQAGTFLAQRLLAWTAMNLDGGGSTTLYLRGNSANFALSAQTGVRKVFDGLFVFSGPP